MQTGDLRRDPLTGVTSVHPDQRHKPFPVARRTLPDTGTSCAFCTLAAAPANENGDIRNGDEWSHLERTSPFSFVIANRWRPFGPTSGADIVIVRRHVTCVEDLEPDETVDFFTALLDQRSRHRREYRRTLAFVNVGLEVNGTQPHLHGQVVSTDFDMVAPLSMNVTSSSLRDDEALARQNRLVLNDSPTAVTYAAWAPTATGELRVIADGPTSLAPAVHDALARLGRAFGTLSYNVVVLEGARLVAQVLPRFTAVGVLPPYFGVAVIMIPPADVAAAMRDA